MDFDLPNAKRVRRSDLHSPSSSPEPEAADPTLESQLQTKLAALYGPISLSFAPDDPSNGTPALKAPKHNEDEELDRDHDQEDKDEEEEQEFEFRLFSAPSNNSNAAPQKIILDDEEEVGEGGFVKREREREYYITSKATGEQRRRFEFAALSGEEVLRGREVRHWGLEVPWRVQVITVTQPTSGKEGRVVSIATEGGEGAGKLAKTKPGKKRRIILREKRRKIEKREEAKKKEKESREEAEREKRTRRNREKKVKRKMKEKALKATGGVVGGGGDETKDIQSGSN